MKIPSLTESVVEEAALAWLESLGWAIAPGPFIAPDEPNPERASWGEVILKARLRDALARLNADALARLNANVSADAIEDAFCKVRRFEQADLAAENRAFHLALIDGITVQVRTDDGTIRG